MRKIQFRGKRKYSGEWVYGYFHRSYTDGSYSIQTRRQNTNEIGLKPLEEFEIDAHYIGQFTGLVDKNEKEIYEGDIVRQIIEDKMEDGGICIITIEIKFEGGCFGWIGEVTGLFHPFHGNDDMLSYEVVGNIFDNPEMLKP